MSKSDKIFWKTLIPTATLFCMAFPMSEEPLNYALGQLIASMVCYLISSIVQDFYVVLEENK